MCLVTEGTQLGHENIHQLKLTMTLMNCNIIHMAELFVTGDCVNFVVMANKNHIFLRVITQTFTNTFSKFPHY
jgi:hypothetical protein